MDAADLAFAGIARQAELIRAGEIAPRELVDVLLARIKRLDPEVRSFRVVLAERALAEADQAAARLKAGDERPLLGVPVAIKDDTDVAGEITAAGAGTHPPPATADAEVVRRLRGAGAIVIGKTQLPELAQWPFTESLAWGATRNPWSLDHTPGGSSGGSGAAVAAGLVGAALASDGGGSIRIPAACCGIFGIKPQRGRVPLAPHDDHWQGLTVFGPVARSVRDAALFLDVIAGSAAPGDTSAAGGFLAAAARPPGRLRIALSRKVPAGIVSRIDAEVAAATEATAARLRALGHDVREQDPDYGLVTLHLTARYLRGIHDDAVAVPEPRRLERRTRHMSRLGGLLTPGALARVRAAEAGFAARVGAIFADYDVVLTPALAWPPVEVGRWHGAGALRTFNRVVAFTPFTPTWNALGNPAVAVPAGFTAGGLPLGAQLVGRPHDEATLVSLAAQLEAEQPWADRRPPIS